MTGAVGWHGFMRRGHYVLSIRLDSLNRCVYMFHSSNYIYLYSIFNGRETLLLPDVISFALVLIRVDIT